MSQRIAGAAALLLLASAPVWANTSVYTPTGGAQCNTVREDPEDAGVVEWVCPAPTGFKATFRSADFYQGVRLTRGRKPSLESDSYVGAHGEMGEKLEWRLAPDGVPVAAILRFAVDEPDDRGEMRARAPKLLVLKITATGACRVGEIPTRRPNANQAARDLADTVTPDTICADR